MTPTCLRVGDVGYSVQTAAGLTPGQEYDLLVHTTQPRDGVMTLYGFLDARELQLFDALTKVSGVGPKAALSLIALGAEMVIAAIGDNDAKTLTQARGIGTSAAQRLLVSVRLPQELTDKAPSVQPTPPLLDTLVGMGFEHAAAERALRDARDVLGAGTAPQLLLRTALASLSPTAASPANGSTVTA